MPAMRFSLGRSCAAAEPRPRVVIAINSAWNILNFRAGLVRALLRDGWEVVVVAPPDRFAAQVEALGCRFVGLSMESWGTNPWRDGVLLRKLKQLLEHERPNALLCYTVKPNVYGSLAARGLGIPVINTISGLGAAFTRSGWFIRSTVRMMYRAALKRSYQVLFQNEEDHHYFISSGLAPVGSTDRVRGSGIDLSAFLPTPLPAASAARPLKFLLVARMLGNKGIREFAEAARLARLQGSAAEFQLLGAIDAANPDSIPSDEIATWQQLGTVRYLGSTDDVRPFIAQAHCVVLPSYREGVPRTLLEAASMARATIASDVAGCRDAVDDGITGYLVRPRDATDLADKLLAFAQHGHNQQQQMGCSGRLKVEREFDERLVIDKYLALLEPLKPVRHRLVDTVAHDVAHVPVVLHQPAVIQAVAPK